MRIRLRGPSGASAIDLPEGATIADLLDRITFTTSLASFDIKYGYPPRPLDLSSYPKTTLLTDINTTLINEQLIIGVTEHVQTIRAARHTYSTETLSQPSRSQDASNIVTLSNRKIAFEKEAILKEVPELPLPDRSALLVLRVMPDDNSCLFRAFATAVLPGDGSHQTMPELRSLIASAIRDDPITYSAVVLEQAPDDYCRWIRTDDAWGGAIELGILASHFEVEICSFDVKTQRIDIYTPPPCSKPTSRILLVYSGIHYDTLVLSPFSNAPPELDEAIFPLGDKNILDQAKRLCRLLRDRGYFTDTGEMKIRCQDCGDVLRGQIEAAEHATRMGHYDMVEVKTAG